MLGLRVQREQFFKVCPLAVFHFRLQFGEPRLQVQNGLNDFGELFFDCELGVKCVILVKIAHAAAFFHRDFTAVPSKFSGQ